MNLSLKSILFNTASTPIRYISNLIDTPAVIFIYHRVTKLEIDTQLLAVSPDNFNEQVSFLKKNYNVVTADEFAHLIQSKKKFPKHTALITFDDGYADNYNEVIPILESNNAEAIFYITTSHINTTNELWWDELERILLTGKKLPQVINLKIKGKDFSFPTSTDEQRNETYFILHPLLKWQLPLHRENLLLELRNHVGVNVTGRATHRLLTFEELKKLHASKSAVIGAHTHSHSPMSMFNKDVQMHEMKMSKDFLVQLLNTKIEHASYPFGSKKDFNADSIEVCKALNFKMTCANYHNQVHSWSNLHALPRVLVRDWNLNEFKEQLKKFYSC